MFLKLYGVALKLYGTLWYNDQR